MGNRTLEELETGAGALPASPFDRGNLEMIVVRTGEGQRSTPGEAMLRPDIGVSLDHWSRGPYSTRPEMQLSLMNSRILDLVSGGRDRWPLAGDNLIVDLDLSVDNLPPGSRLEVGSAIIEMSEKVHRGCEKFSSRYGQQAREFVNSDQALSGRFRGAYARVIQSGTVAVGDVLLKL